MDHLNRHYLFLSSVVQVVGFYAGWDYIGRGSEISSRRLLAGLTFKQGLVTPLSTLNPQLSSAHSLQPLQECGSLD